MKLSEFGEEAFLRELEVRFPAATAGRGIGDDAALVDLPPAERALVTVDALVEGVHFTTKTLPPRFLGRKAVSSSASDVAAMGGEGLSVLLSLVVRDELEVDSLWEMVDGASERAFELGMELAGGNLARSAGPIVAGVTVLGHTLSGRALLRSGARAGDGIYVTGKMGASAAGLALVERGVALSPTGGLIVPESLREGPLAFAEACIRAHIDPEPRLEVGRELNRSGLATACIDISDGLSLDLHRLCRASGVGASIEEAALPVSPGALAWARAFRRDPLLWALSGGEDYELLFTASGETAVNALRDASPVGLTRIGEIRQETVVQMKRRDGTVEELSVVGWDHFRRG